MKFFSCILIFGLSHVFSSITEAAEEVNGIVTNESEKNRNKELSISGKNPANPVNPSEAALTDVDALGIARMMLHLEIMSRLKSSLIPVDERGKFSGSEEFVGIMSEAYKMALLDTNVVNPSIRFDLPGNVLLDDKIFETCYNFRMMKNSISSSAFSKKEKLDFLDNLSYRGCFFNFRGMDLSGVEAAKKNPNFPKKEKLKYEKAAQAASAAILLNNFFCRDAIRLAADALDKDQLCWFLNHSPTAIIGQPEILDGIKNFAFFSDNNVLDAIAHSGYDWFKNSAALKTLKPSALLAIIRHHNYSLSSSQLEALNEARPLKELFATPEFVADAAFIWQAVYNSPHFDSSHVSIDALVAEIEKSHPQFMSPVLKQTVFYFYYINDFSIGVVLSKILCAPDIHPPEGANLEVFKSIHHSIANQNLDTLEKLIDDRARVISALEKKISSFDEVDKESRLFLRVLKTPFNVSIRKGLVESEKVVFNDLEDSPLEVGDLIDTMGTLKEIDFENCKNDLGKCKHWEGNALIFAYLRARNGKSVKNSDSAENKNFMFPFEFDAQMTTMDWLKMLNELFIIGVIDDLEESNEEIGSQEQGKVEEEAETEVVLTNSAKMLFFSIAMNLAFGGLYQIHEYGLEAHEANLEYLFKNLLARCNLDQFNEYEIEMLTKLLPIQSKELIDRIEESRKIENKFKAVKEDFLRQYQVLRQAEMEMSRATELIQSVMLLNLGESMMQASLQEIFKPEFYDFIRADGAVLKIIGERAYLLGVKQVEEAFSSESGIALLGANRDLLYNLPTYEFMKASQIKPLKFQAQFATRPSTILNLVKLISFKSENWEFEDRLGVSIRTGGLSDAVWLNEPEILMQAWRFVPFQMIAQMWMKAVPEGKPLSSSLSYHSVSVTRCLLEDRSISRDYLAIYRTILHWIIKRELNFLEAFGLLYTHTASHYAPILNSIILTSHAEDEERNKLMIDWIPFLSQEKVVVERLSETFSEKMIHVLGGPMSGIRAGAYLSAANLMNKTLRTFRFNPIMGGFTAWKKEFSDEITAKARENPQEFNFTTLSEADMSNSNLNRGPDFTSEAEGFTMKTLLDSSCSLSNISGVTQMIEEDVFKRRTILASLLIEVDRVLKVDSEITAMWLERIKLLGMVSGNGFTLGSNYQNDPVNLQLLTLSDRIIYHRAATALGIIGNEDVAELQRMASFAIHTEIKKSQK